MPSFIKNKDNGKYYVIGPPHVVVADKPCEVTKRDGSKISVTMETTGKPFVAKLGNYCGQTVVIGKIAGTGQRRTRKHEKRRNDELYCGYRCSVSGKKCCQQNGPCHDCQ